MARRDAGAGAGANGGISARAAQSELFSEEKSEESRATRHPWAWLRARLFAVQSLVCVHCAGKLRRVEIATEAAALKRIIRDERRRRGEPVGEMEARGPPGRLMFALSVRETECR